MYRIVCVSFVLATMLPDEGWARTQPFQEYERPASYRLAINGVLGDVSYLQRFGQLPSPGTDSDLRVQTHLEFVHALLSERDISTVPPALRQNRRQGLSHLREYIDAGVFPRNDRYRDQSRPCFIDKEGRICAVGYLVERSAGRQTAEQINEKFQWEFLWRMKMPALDRWVADSGFSLVELSMIQPNYGPVFNGTFALDSPRAPATLTLDGGVNDSDCGCDTERVIMYFGDGSSWDSGIVNEFVVPVEVEHLYPCPGNYRVVGIGFASESCPCGPNAWAPILFWNSPDVTVLEPAFVLQALPDPDVSGATYLATQQDIRLEHIASATIDWGDGSVEPVQWSVEEDLARTQPHTYATPGPFTISVTNNYEGLCSFSQESSLQITPSVATVQASWGCLKAKYEAGS